MNTIDTGELMDNLNFFVEAAVQEVIKSYIPTLDAYLDELDKGEFECECTTAKIKFHKDHRITASIPVEVPEGFTWAFNKPFIEVEVDGTFESHLS